MRRSGLKWLDGEKRFGLFGSDGEHRMELTGGGSTASGEPKCSDGEIRSEARCYAMTARIAVDRSGLL